MLAKAVFCALSVFAIAAAHALTWTESRGPTSPNVKGQGCLKAGNEFSNANLKDATLDGADFFYKFDRRKFRRGKIDWCKKFQLRLDGAILFKAGPETPACTGLS